MSDDDAIGQSGWIPISKWGDKYRHRFCESEKHHGTFTSSDAVACIIFYNDDPAMIWGVCQKCLNDLIATGFAPTPLENLSGG